LSAGKTVKGAAIAHRTAAMLRSELEIDATAIDRLLMQIKSAQHILDRNTVLLIDECGQVGSKTMNELTEAVAKSGAKLVLIGDRTHLQPISAGPALKILSSIVQPARVDQIVRQRESWAQDAARAFSKGDAAAGLEAYRENGLLRGCAGAGATVRSAVDCYVESQALAPDKNHLLIAKSNKTVRALNAENRSRMRSDGVLIGPDHTIMAGDASGTSYRLHLAIGDMIRFGMRHNKIGRGVINGTVGRIEGIDELDGRHVLVRATVDGERVEFSTGALTDRSGRVRLSHDLAVTAYSSQGLTAETATVVLGTEYDRHDSYVALSRARGDTTIFFDQSLLVAQTKTEQELRSKKDELSESAEMAYLAARISRANLKTSTLALVADQDRYRDQERARERNGLSL
jgi:ATP-dependent exoDNAse (exonuclease V) alpha subunit